MDALYRSFGRVMPNFDSFVFWVEKAEWYSIVKI